MACNKCRLLKRKVCHQLMPWAMKSIVKKYINKTLGVCICFYISSHDIHFFISLFLYLNIEEGFDFDLFVRCLFCMYDL